MSMFQRIFGGGSKKDVAATPEQAIQQLSSVEDMLLKKQEHLEGLIDAEKANALRCSKQGNKKGALTALKKKKQYEKNLLQIDGTLTTIESQREALQNATTNKEIFKVIQQSTKAITSANGEIDVDAVHDLKDEMDEQLGLADEISSAISSPGLRDRDAYSEADLLKELDELAGEEDLRAMVDLPDVPISTTQSKVKVKDNPEKELEAWING